MSKLRKLRDVIVNRYDVHLARAPIDRTIRLYLIVGLLGNGLRQAVPYAPLRVGRQRCGDIRSGHLRAHGEAAHRERAHARTWSRTRAEARRSGEGDLGRVGRHAVEHRAARAVDDVQGERAAVGACWAHCV